MKYRTNRDVTQGVPGASAQCPLCGELLPDAEMGVNAHLRKHIRAGVITKEQEQAMRRQILNRPFRTQQRSE